MKSLQKVWGNITKGIKGLHQLCFYLNITWDGFDNLTVKSQMFRMLQIAEGPLIKLHFSSYSKRLGSGKGSEITRWIQKLC